MLHGIWGRGDHNQAGEDGQKVVMLSKSVQGGAPVTGSTQSEPSLRGALATEQSILSFRREMDCFASLAMTISRQATLISQRLAPEVLLSSSSNPPFRGRGEWPGADAPRQNVRVVRRGHTDRPAFPAQWFIQLLRAHPGDRAFLPPSLAGLTASLTPASRCQVHTTWPSASQARPSRALPRPTTAHPTLKTLANAPPSWNGMRII
jgi:hypothetical protein